MGQAVLLVEEVEEIRAAVALALGQPAFGWTVREAATLQEALTALAAGGIDAVLLDLNLSDSAGIATLEAVCAAAARLPVLVLTASVDEASAEAAVRLGVQDYLSKSQIDGATLDRALRHATERKRGEEALRQSEERFRALVEHSADAVILTDAQGTTLYQSPAALRILGHAAAERIGKSGFEVVHPADRARLQGVFAECVRVPGHLVECEFRARRADGSYLDLRAVAVNRLDQPAIRAVVINYQDVSQVRQAEDARRTTEQRLAAVARATSDVIWDWNIEKGTLWRSEGTELGFHGEGEPGLDTWMSRIHEDDRDRVVAGVRAAVDSGATSWSDEYRFQRADGAFAVVLDRGQVIRENGRPLRMLGAMLDVTERRSLEEQLRHAQKMEAVGRLAGGVAHDFNNLLTAILGYADLAQRLVPAGGPVSSKLAEICQAGERAAALTHQLLAFSRKQVLAPEVLDLDAVVRDLSGMLRRLLGEDIVLSLSAAAGARHHVRADRTQLEQVLMNLAVNARDAMPHGGTLRIGTRVVDVDPAGARQQPPPAGRYVVLEVADDGAGMDALTRAHAFEPFFTTKPTGKGTGLGLATVYGIVQQSGGHVRVESDPGRGATFSVYLPLLAESPAERQAAETGLPAGIETVLLVEDEPMLRAVTRETLELSGYRVLEAGSGSEVFDSVLPSYSGPVDLLLTDVVMPGMNGRQVAERLLLTHPSTKVLFTSGYMDDAALQRGVMRDSSAFLAKPFTPSTLARKVRSVLDGG